MNTFSRSRSSISERTFARFVRNSKKMTFSSDSFRLRKYISWNVWSSRRYESCRSRLYVNTRNYYERNCPARRSGGERLSDSPHECPRYPRSRRKIHQSSMNTPHGKRKNRNLRSWNGKSIFYH